MEKSLLRCSLSGSTARRPATMAQSSCDRWGRNHYRTSSPALCPAPLPARSSMLRVLTCSLPCTPTCALFHAARADLLSALHPYPRALPCCVC
eukprot:scaffold374_cov108-Isochrysis_galbana.AAC.3